MYVRWKSKPLSRRRRLTGRHSLYAILVECRREDGKPRQKVVKHLGAIPDDKTGPGNYYFKRDFWESALAALETLSLTEEARQTLMERIARRVPLPTASDRDADVSRLDPRYL